MDKQLIDNAHEIWAAAQLLPGEGIEDGAKRIAGILARIDAERGKDAVAFRLTDGDDVEYNGIDQFSCGRTGGEPLFISPTIPEGMVLVPPEKPLPDLMLASYHEAIGWNACREAMIAAAQGEK